MSPAVIPAVTTVDPTTAWQHVAEDLRRFVQRRVKDAHTAEDLVQDVFLKFARHLQAGPPEGPLHAWIFRTAQNAIIDHYRGQRAETEDSAALAAENATDTTFEDEPLFASFRTFLHSLPAEQREALLRTEYEGLTQKQLAAELGIPLSTVKSRVQRGKQRLGEALRDCCSFEFDRRGHLVDWQRKAGGDCKDCR